MNTVFMLEGILAREREIYELVFSLEKKKMDAILERDGRGIERISAEQELLIREIGTLEGERIEQVKRIGRVHKKGDTAANMTLGDIAASVGEESARKIIKTGRDLRDLLLKIKDIQALNGNLLGDCMDFYNMLLTGLRSGLSSDTGYGEKGKEEGRIADSILFNKTA